MSKELTAALWNARCLFGGIHGLTLGTSGITEILEEMQKLSWKPIKCNATTTQVLL